MCSAAGCPIAWFALKSHLPSFLLTAGSGWCRLCAKEKNGNPVPLTYVDTLAFGGEQGQKVGEDNWKGKGAKAWSSIPRRIHGPRRGSPACGAELKLRHRCSSPVLGFMCRLL